MSKMNIISQLRMPTPVSISYMWNFGSLLGLLITIQIVSGVMISMFYIPSASEAFESLVHLKKEVEYGWLLYFIHSSFPSIIFLFIFIHIGRGLIYKSFVTSMSTWVSGVVILVMMMAISFLGYVLPWGQMSFWGATVITSLISSVPYVGGSILTLIWGDFSVAQPLLSRLYSLHFLLSLVLVTLLLAHLVVLHKKGSSNPISDMSNKYKIPFSSYFLFKDLFPLCLVFIGVFLLLLLDWSYFLESDNFIMSNPMVTPAHIKPEWYFLLSYAILRSVPSKLGGVILMVLSIGCLALPVLSGVKTSFSSVVGDPMYYNLVLTFFWVVVCLTYLGGQPAEEPFLTLSFYLMIMYFGLISMISFHGIIKN